MLAPGYYFIDPKFLSIPVAKRDDYASLFGKVFIIK